MKKGIHQSGFPMYKQIADRIASDMARGLHKPGEPLPSIQTLTASLGVARNTVIGALRLLVKTGRAISYHGKGFYPKPIVGSQPIVDVLVPLHYTYHLQVYVGLIAGAQDAAEKIGARVEFHDTRETSPDFLAQLHKVSALRPGGRIIAVPPMENFGPVGCPECGRALEQYALSGARIVVVDRRGPASLPRIIQDRREGRRLLLRHALKAGCRALLFCDAFEDEKALRAEAAAHHRARTLYFAKAKTIEDLRDLVMRLGVDALLCTGDLQARRLINLCGGRLEFKLAGYDATPLATSFHPRITSVNSNLTEAGFRAVEMLFSAHALRPEEIRIKPFLMVGETL